MADKEYIEREAALNEQMEICHWDGLHDSYDDFVSVKSILSIPAADVAEVRHGEWKSVLVKFGASANTYVGREKCSICGKLETKQSDYCPNCGAKMDGKGEGE